MRRAVYRTVSILLIGALVATILPALSAGAAGETISGGSNTSGYVEVDVPIDDVQVTGAGSSVVPITLEVDEGELSMRTTTGLTFTGDNTGSTLKFQGTVSNVNAALATLRYRNVNATTVTFRAQITGTGEVYFPGNGHIYEIVNAPNLTADQARTAAAARTKYGATGYLATITTQEENDYVAPRLSGDGWFGASDADAEGSWEWSVGPENNTVFWSGLSASAGGTPVGGRYSNWASGEPNNAGNEDCAQFYSNGSGWNDLPCGTTTLNYYVVEYGTTGSLPAVPNTTFTITTTVPPVETTTVSTCNELRNAGATGNRRDNIVLTKDIDCTGQTVEPLFDEDSAFGTFPYVGTFDGKGYTIKGITLNDPARDNYGLISYAEGATIKNLRLEGVTVTGHSCVGGIVGRAHDTTIDNVSVAIKVYATADKAGGIVGCLNSVNDDAGVTNSDASSEVDSTGNFGGGIIGIFNVDYGNTGTVENNTFTGSLADSSAAGFGGIAGGIWASTASMVEVNGNTSATVNVPGGETVGGIIGQLRALTGTTVDMSENSLTGNVVGSHYVGGLIGWAYNNNSAINISHTALEAVVSSVNNVAGGFIGYSDANGNSSTITIIYAGSFKGEVSSGASNVGGLIGYHSTNNSSEQLSISSSFVDADISADNEGAGGLVGTADKANIIRSYSKGSVTAPGSYVGGLVGFLTEASVINQSYSTMAVEGDTNVGGLVGRISAPAQVKESFALGAIEGNTSVGGLAGNVAGSIDDSYARGTVTGTDKVGGLAGSCTGNIRKTYATGTVAGTTQTGGLAGYNGGGCTIANSTWDTETSSQSTSFSTTGNTTAVMKTPTTYTSGMASAWDFADIWLIKRAINNGYPCLKWYDYCGVVDNDGDGILDSVEATAPNGGDANNDGIADATQDYVASFVSVASGAYTSTQLPAQCFFSAASSQTENAQTVQDSGFDYAHGLVDFTADCGTSGYTAVITLVQFGTTKDNLVLRKFKPSNNAYFAVPGAALNNVTIGGAQAVEADYTITDGGSLDDDNTTNGIITDPVGLALSTVGTPNTGLQRTVW